MMRIFWVGCAVIAALAFAVEVGAQDKPLTVATQAQSTFSSQTGPDGDSFSIVNSTFDATEVSINDRRQVERVLVEQRLVSTQNWETDSATPELTVTARVIAKGAFATPLWSFHEQADRGEIWSDYYRTTVLGREGGEDLVRYRELATGQMLFLTTTDPLFVDLANTGSKSRVITYVSNKTGYDFAFIRRTPDAFGLLTMRQGSRVVDQLLLIGESTAVDGWSPKIVALDRIVPDATYPEGVRELTLFKREGKSEAEAWSGFDLRLRYADDAERPLIVIPVEGGKFAIEKASLPQGISLRRDMAERETSIGP